MIRVFYDSQIFLAQRRGGISRYFVELIRHFRENKELGIEPLLGISSSNNVHAQEDIGLPLRPGAHLKVKRGADLLAQSVLDNSRRDYDLRHFTFYSPGYAKFSGVTVSTLYDMIPELFGQSMRNPHMNKKKFMERSTGVLSISRTSLRDMESLYKFQAPFTAVTHLGVSGSFDEHFPPPQDIPSPYMLFVGQRFGYKRGRMALDALANLGSIRMNLVFVGPEPATRSELALIRHLGLERRVFFQEASDDALKRLYANATLLLFPNLYEGFGFPPVEACRSGTPVVAADNAINREISLEGVTYFEPDNLGDFVRAIEEVLITRPDQARRREYIESSLRFNWGQCAAETAEFYKMLAVNAGA